MLLITKKVKLLDHYVLFYLKWIGTSNRRESDSKIKTNFFGNEVPKENMHYTCIACITIDSVTRINNKSHAQVYLEEYKYRVKKKLLSRSINTELKSDSEPDSEESDSELMAKLKSDSE